MPVGDRIENCSALRARRNETRASSLRYSGSSAIGCCGSLANWPSAVPPREMSKRPQASAERSIVSLLNHEDSVSLVPISGSKRHFYCSFLGRFDDDWVPGEYATIGFRSATQGIRRGTKRIVGTSRGNRGLLFQKSRPRSCDPNRERILSFSPRKFVASVPRYDQLQSRRESPEYASGEPRYPRLHKGAGTDLGRHDIDGDIHFLGRRRGCSSRVALAPRRPITSAYFSYCTTWAAMTAPTTWFGIP